MPDRSHLRKDQVAILERRDRKEARKLAKMNAPLETGEAQKAAEAAVAPLRTFKALGIDRNGLDCAVVKLEISICADGQYRVVSATADKTDRWHPTVNRFKVLSQTEILK